MSKYNEVMENLVIDEEMKKRLLANIEKEVGTESIEQQSANGNEELSDTEDVDAKKKQEDISKPGDDNKKEKSSGKIIKFLYRYGSRVAVFALVMLGAYGVITVVGLNSNKSSDMATSSSEMAEDTSASYESEATSDADYAYETEATEAAGASEYDYEEEAAGAAEDYNDSVAMDNSADVTESSDPQNMDSDRDIKDSSKDFTNSGEQSTDKAIKGDVAAEDDSEKAGMPTESTSDKLTITMAGDVLLHTPVAEAGLLDDGRYDFNFIFDETRDEIESADIAIVNQEVVLGGKELGVTGYPSFNAPYELGDALVNAGFDVVCHATNHVLDKGKKGLLNTINFWKNSYPDITVAGINESEEEYDKVRIVEKNGMKIAILNYTYGLNGISVPSDMSYAVDLLKEDKVIADLKYAEENADFTVVCPHWGTEYNHGIDSMQEKWTEIFREYGADLVIGTHPHVIEPVEMLEDGKSGISNNHGDGDMLVYYSIGNFVNWTSGTGDGTADRMVGGLANISLKRDENGEVCIDDYSIRALVCHVQSGPKNISVLPLSKYDDNKASKNEIIDQDSNFSKSYCENLCDEIWGDLWK